MTPKEGSNGAYTDSATTMGMKNCGGMSNIFEYASRRETNDLGAGTEYADKKDEGPHELAQVVQRKHAERSEYYP